MIRVENVDVWGFEHAVRGMRNPMNSHDKSDSCYCEDTKCSNCRMYHKDGCHRPRLGRRDRDHNVFIIGKADMELMQKLYKAGPEHRKYLRQIMCSMDIVAPLYWWKEADQYRIGVTTNSCSTMHKIASKEFTLEDFSHEHLTDMSMGVLAEVCRVLNAWRTLYIDAKDKEDWWQLIQLLPSSYNQRRTITMNYENVISIIKQRTGHKLDEWNEFVEALKDLPYIVS